MNTRRSSAAVGAFPLSVLSGCVTFSGIDKGVASLMGQSVDQVVGRIGYPTAQREFEGRKLYVWSNSQNFTMYLPQTTQTTGNIYGTAGMATYNETTTYTRPCKCSSSALSFWSLAQPIQFNVTNGTATGAVVPGTAN